MKLTFGVPVYHGEKYLAEALRSIQQQTFREFRVVISLDGAQPAAEEICAPFLADDRFELHVQPKRLGWVGNINWLFSQVNTPFWCYQQQDDLIDPEYVETLLSYANRTPEAAVVYCDISNFGNMEGVAVQRSVVGHPVARQLALLTDHHPAVAFRGLTRVEALREGGGIRTNGCDNFSTDTVWMSGVARWGELHRVPGTLYRKRYHGENEHSKWAAWPREKRSFAWCVHCADMLEEAMLVDATIQERRQLWLGAVSRLVSPRIPQAYVPQEQLDRAARIELLTQFLHELQDVRRVNVASWVDDSWEHLIEWTNAAFWLPPESTRSKRSGWFFKA